MSMSGCSNSSAVMTYYSKECGSASAELQVQQQQAVRVCVRMCIFVCLYVYYVHNMKSKVSSVCLRLHYVRTKLYKDES